MARGGRAGDAPALRRHYDGAANAKPKKRVREVKAVIPIEAVKQNPKGVKVIPTSLINS